MDIVDLDQQRLERQVRSAISKAIWAQDTAANRIVHGETEDALIIDAVLDLDELARIVASDLKATRG